MNNYQSITASPEALAAFLGSIPAIETPWDDAFHRLYCSSCSATDCDDCRRPERDIAFLQAATATVLSFSLNKSKAENTTGGITYDTATKRDC